MKQRGDSSRDFKPLKLPSAVSEKLYMIWLAFSIDVIENQIASDDEEEMEPYGILQLPEQPRYDLTEQYFCKNSHLIEIVAMFQCYQDNFLAITHIYIYIYIYRFTSRAPQR